MFSKYLFNHLLSTPYPRFSTNRTSNQAVSLAYDKLPGGDGRSPLLILHGLLGNRNNWRSIAKALNRATNRTVYTLDARNHGLSPHTVAITYPLMGQDVVQFLQQEQLQQAVIMGHSMGGRTAMAVALNSPHLVSQLLVLDISPFGVSESISTLPRFVEMMRRVQLPAELSLQQARSTVDTLLLPVVREAGVRQFLLTNLYKSDSGEFKWRANLEAISRTFNPHICTFPLVECGPRYDGGSAFIGGALSDYLRPSDEPAIRGVFPAATFHYLAGAGHWLHADKPKEFLELVVPIIADGP